MRNCLYGFSVGLATLAGCASAPGASTQRDSLPNDPIAPIPQPWSACKAWRVPLHAHLSHITASRDGGRILVSTSAERRSEARLRLLDGKGRVAWTRDLPQPVKAQAMAPDGSLFAVSTYDGALSAYDRRGKKLWSREHLGRPVVLAKSGRVVVINDDDSEPKTAFITYDFRGNAKATVQIPRTSPDRREPLDVFIADDESYLAVAMTDGSLGLFDPDGKALAEGKTPGDVIAVAAQGSPARIYVLSIRREKKAMQALSVFEIADGRRLAMKWTVDLDRKYETLRAFGDALFLYGNTHLGQALAAHASADGKELWKKSYRVPANYSSLVFSGTLAIPRSPVRYATAAIEDERSIGTLHLLGITAAGMAAWDAAIGADDGIYSYAVADDGPALVVGVGEPGDGIVEYYRVARAGCR